VYWLMIAVTVLTKGLMIAVTVLTKGLMIAVTVLTKGLIVEVIGLTIVGTADLNALVTWGGIDRPGP
jgi:hypothetical protein